MCGFNWYHTTVGERGAGFPGSPGDGLLAIFDRVKEIELNSPNPLFLALSDSLKRYVVVVDV